MRKQIQDDAEIADQSENCGIGASCDDPASAYAKGNSFVFLDLKIDHMIAGRIVIELFNSIAPRTCENFRQLCCNTSGLGSAGRPLSYKNTLIHKTTKQAAGARIVAAGQYFSAELVTLFPVHPGFMIQGGDVTHHDGSGGESIYGPTFEDETFDVQLEPGIVGMVNRGSKDTNSSQFFISCVPFPHLQNTHVAFGKVRKGFQIVQEISNLPIVDDVPTKEVLIHDCGELPSDPAKWEYIENDGWDQYPPYPEDWELNVDVSSTYWAEQASKAVENIKKRGNDYFLIKSYKMALRKYDKALRYLTWIKSVREEVFNACSDLLLACLSNMAAANINCQNFKSAYQLCCQVVELKPDAKAYFRRGQANFGLHDYNAALQDLEEARLLEPKDKKIYTEIAEVKNAFKQSKTEEIRRCANMLK